MAFVISKPSLKDGSLRELYYLVESYREGGKIKRRTIHKLKEHKSIDEAITTLEEKKQPLVEKMRRLEQEKELASQGRHPDFSHYPPYLQERNIIARMSFVYADIQGYEDKIADLKKIKEKYGLVVPEQALKPAKPANF